MAMNVRAESVGQAQAMVVSRNLYPPRVEDMTGAVNLLHSYAWEESAFPAQWVRNFNKHLSGIACLSTHVRKVLQDNGVNVPMAVSGCGVDHWERVEPSAKSVLDDLAPRQFRFLHVSSCFPRKGPEALLAAYGKAFSAADDVSLVIKTFPNPHNLIHSQIDAARQRIQDFPHVIVIEDDLSDGDLKALYERCDVLVAPSCAEGFGLPLAEAMLSGMPVIATAWSGQMDFCSPESSWLVDYRYEQADTHFKLLPSAWAAVDVDALASAMTEAFRAEPEVRGEMARRGRDLLLKEFTWRTVAERLIAFYGQLRDAGRSLAPRIGWVTTWNVKCGIATYSDHLVRGLKVMPVILAARSHQTIGIDTDSCVRCWDMDDIDDLSALASSIEANELDAIILQFNFGFFNHEKLAQFVESQKSAGRVIVIDMHATNDPPQAPHKKLANFVPALEMVDRLLVHSIADMNRLKSLGLSDNLVLFPHGILDASVSVSDKKDSGLGSIATYGFCLPHKGLEEVVRAVGLLRDAGKPVQLKMVNAEYPVDFSADLAGRLRSQIEGLGLGERATLETRFLSDAESLEILKSVDLVVFAYHPTSESASGAVRYGLASGKPTLVTDLPIFSEFGDGVWRVSSNEPAQLAKAIWSVLEDIRQCSPEHIRRQELARNWREQHSYSWLSERLEGLIGALHSAQCTEQEKRGGHPWPCMKAVEHCVMRRAEK
jgi:glycosyltransferase involved in cell wall biosynthesis